MSELVKQWKAIKQKKFYLTLPASTTAAGLDEIASEATEIGDKMADLIEKQDAEIKTLKSLAVCSSGEGTSFYYKDDWEARGKNIEKLERLLSLYRDYFKWLDDEYTKESWATGREIREKIKQMEETL